MDDRTVLNEENDGQFSPFLQFETQEDQHINEKRRKI
jgi:hypothetical protein